MSGVGVGGGGVIGWPRIGPTGPTGPTGSAGAQGDQGDQGAQGSQGPGILFFRRGHDESDTAPGVFSANQARMNNATESSATEIYVSIYDATGTGDESTLLDMLGDGTSAVKGILRLEVVGQPSYYAVYQLNSVASGASYYTLGVTHLASSHSGDPFSDGYVLWYTFVPKGDKGDAGAVGATGPTGPAGAGGSAIIVQSGDSDVDTATETLDFDASDFTITSSPAGEANIALAYGTSAGTPAEGNHTHLLAAGATDVTASSAELNILDGATLTVTELNYVDGVTSAIQTQLDGKQPLDADLTTLSTAFTTASASGAASLAFHEDTDNGTNRALLQGPASTADVTITLPATTGTVALTSDITLATLGLDADLATFSLPASTTISAFGATLVDDAAASNARTTLGLVIGTDVQAQNARLAEIASLADPNADRLLAWDDSADDIIYTTPTKGFCVPIGNGVDVISTGVQATEVSLPVGGVWTKWRLLKSLPAGNVSIVVDIWKDTYANWPPSSDSICASDKPTISTAEKNEGTSLTGWTTTFAAGDTLRFNVDSVTSATRVWLCLEFREVF